ncbi:MAG: hypothetical protein ACPGSC_03815 [Granulosicoccaceae bacterium]
MDLQTISAYLYALLAMIPLGCQLALAAGAPWGEYTLGGQFPGVLPKRLRPVAVVQALILLAMAIAVLSKAKAISLAWPEWTFLVTGAITFATFLANTFTPSIPERRLWSPVTFALLLLYALVYTL